MFQAVSQSVSPSQAAAISVTLLYSGFTPVPAVTVIYRGAGVAPGKKSVAFNLVLRADDRSLTAEEADADVKSILDALLADCGAVLR